MPFKRNAFPFRLPPGNSEALQAACPPNCIFPQAQALENADSVRKSPGDRKLFPKGLWERTRGLEATRIPLVAGGVYGGHGRGFFPGKSLPCRFCWNPQDSSKIWIGWPWRGSLLPHPPSLLRQVKAAERLVQPPLFVLFRNDRFGGKTAPRSVFSQMNPPEFPFRFRRQEACRPFSTCL